MDLCPTDDQSVISTSAADFLQQEFPADRMPRHTETQMPVRAWRSLADMGWFGLGLDEAAGGLGLSVIEEALVAREFGRVLLPPSALATILAGHIAAAGDDPALVASLIEGETRAGFAVARDAGKNERQYYLVDSNGADLFVLWSGTEASLVSRDAFAAVEVVEGLDASIEVSLAQGREPSGLQSSMDVQQFNNRARVLCAAMLVGGAEASRDISVEYAKTRQQFGRPIGEFQAISHRCAKMAVECEASLALLHYAAVAARDGAAEAETYCAAARLVAGNTAREAAENAMQIFGGYGQTYDYLPHFYLKRAHIYQALGDGGAAEGESILAAPSVL